MDVGGTKIAAGVITPQGEALSRVRYPTSSSPEILLSTLVRAINEVREGFEVGGVCLSVPGFVSERENRVVYSPNLHAVEGIPLKEVLEPRIGLPLTVENDANAAAWGELRFGLGREVEHLVMVTLGTGIGGGVISHGILLRGAQGAAGELGHVTVLPDGPRCACGNRGCLEVMASGTSIGRRAREVAARYPGSALAELAMEREIVGEDVSRLAAAGDEGALAVLAETGRWLGIGLASFVNVFNPEVVAIGGGAVDAGEPLLGPAREEVRLRARPPSRDLVVVKGATLGPESGMFGAAALARDPKTGRYILDEA